MPNPEQEHATSDYERKEGVAAFAMSMGASFDQVKEIIDSNTSREREDEIIEELKKSGRQIGKAAA